MAEIIVKGFRRRIDPWTLDIDREPPEPSPDPGGSPGGAPVGALVSPGAPKVIEEIVATGKRVPKLVRGVPRSPRFSVGALIATVGGFLTAKILEELSQQQLDRAFAELEAIRGRVKPDTPLVTTPKVVTPLPSIPEIIVTARRTKALQLPPMPQFDYPDLDFVVLPRPQVQPEAQPFPEGAPEIMPATAPQEIPTQRPGRTRIRRIPKPEIRTRTDTRIETSPLASPFATPFASPAASPFAAPLAFRSPSGLTQRQRQAVPLRRTQRTSGFRPTICPPCPTTAQRKKKKEEKRDTCYKQLVKQRWLPSLDKTYDLVEIDCFTGRELN